MNHLDDGRMQAFLDDELPAGERAAVAEHLLACGECRATRDELTRAGAVFSEAMATLDAAAPPRSAAAGEGRHRRFGSGSLVKVAGLILLLTAAASTAVPGSPLRDWIVQAVTEPAEDPPVADMAPIEAAPMAPPLGVSLRPAAGVTIVLAGLEGVTIRLTETEGERVSVSAVGAEKDPAFSTASDRIEVRDGAGGDVIIELPRSLESARVLVDGEVYAVKVGGELQLRGPDSVNGAGATNWQ